MGVNSSKGFNFRLMASGSNGFTELDLFKDEIITVSDNVTGLFDIGVLPSDFTRQILVPGTKKNNAFFEHVYDIAVENPYLFETNVKVPAYFDFDGLYVSQGYLQLNKVNVYANRFVDSYEISIYGTLSSFARDINRLYLTDLTSSLAQYNHTSSIQNITSSWENNLFSGDIVYPLAEYGQKIQYTPDETQFGIDSISGSLCVQDFKPAIRIKPVWDAIFETAGYTYSSSFMNQSFLDGVYMICNNQLRYPVYDDINLETYGLFKIGPISGSGVTDLILPSGSTNYQLPWYSIQNNPNGNMSSSLEYTLDFTTKLRGEIKLNFEVTPDDSTSIGYPQFNLVISGSAGNVSTPLVAINNYMQEIYTYNLPFNKTETFNLLNEWSIGSVLPAGKYKFFINYTSIPGGDPEFVITLDPSGKAESYLSVTKVNQGGDGKVINIAKNMPFGTNGIKLVDFIKGIQRKYNLVIYPSKTQQKQFIVETFNDWYNGDIKDFDKYINLDEKIEVIPANNLAVNELNFGDTLDTDYVSQQFQKENNREFGKTYYVDTENFFSQGTFEVKTTFASSPIIYLSGTGDSGSVVPSTDNKVSVSDADNGTEEITCLGSSYTNDVRVTTVTYVDSTGTPTINYGAPVAVTVKYDTGLCFGGTSYLSTTITIPYGASSATYQYYSTAYVDCGSAPCTTETQTINCVESVTGQTGIGLYSSSPIIAC
jgi:hypothetical protein